MPAVQEANMVPHGAIPRLGAIKEKKGLPDLRTAAAGPKPDIIDIRTAAVEINLKAEVLSQFHTKDGARKLPTLLLYDERGLQLFEKVRFPLRLPPRGHPTLTGYRSHT
jgi:L-histidine Nalpha-methyltransferase / hercynylcysteine S-oxide synthase